LKTNIFNEHIPDKMNEIKQFLAVS